MCQDTQGQSYRCGQRAALAPDDLIGERPVDCDPRDVDRYGRIVAVCRVAGVDVGEWMVAHGWALAYRDYSLDYVDEEDAARDSRLGMWAGTFIAPWDFRHGTGNSTTTTAIGECLIKGNISSSGERIYHVPGGQYYVSTAAGYWATVAEQEGATRCLQLVPVVHGRDPRAARRASRWA
ncbi:MAG: thermonuclease family protein, partial [Alphaproteobacteria bacterium]|nr:thermonuclease family protein [Alphaproteobacteria bacterium]